MRILSIFGTRPEAIKMAPVVKELAARGDRFESIICSTAQHREMLDQVTSLFGIVPDIDLNLMRQGQTLAGLTSTAVRELGAVMERVKPDAVLVQGDTTTAMAGALVAFYGRIPVGHVEAGLRTGDRYSPFPEEVNRRIISSVAEWHFAPTEKAAASLRSEGVPADRVHVTGNTVVDALLWVTDKTVGVDIAGEGKKLILVTAHRRENLGKPLERICLALRRLAEQNKDVVVFYPVHPNPSVKNTVEACLRDQPRIFLESPLTYDRLVAVLKSCHFVLTDSGGIQEEAPALGKPVLVLREETERPEAIEAGVAKLVGTDTDTIVREAERLLTDEVEYLRMARAVNPFGDGHAARRIVDILSSNVGSLRRDPA